MTFWTDPAEQEFLESHLRPDMSMLEYGSGHSTLVLQERVKNLVSVEHSFDWYNKLKGQLKDNVEYIYRPPSNPLWEQQFNRDGTKNAAGDDGTFEDFASYVVSPLGKTFDVIFIDGRARVACAWMASFMLNHGGAIFIHDFGSEAPHPYLPYRTYYDVVQEWLTLEDKVKTMAKFKVNQ